MADNSFVWMLADWSGKIQGVFYNFDNAVDSLPDSLRVKKSEVSSNNSWVLSLGDEKWKLVRFPVKDANQT